MSLAASDTGAGRWIVAIVLLALGVWLVAARRRWARDVYTPPLAYLGRGGPALVTVLGVLLIVAAIWALVAPG